ncbi:unnamed protein product [Peniophora sp. CBMAI 1063]|nr:unnamed protein product [Peniophora sp. CBMAI 1063]
MASILNRFSKDLNNSINQVQTDLQSSRFAPLQRRTSNTSIRSYSRPPSVSSIGNPYKSAPSNPQITSNTVTPATNLLSSFTSNLPPALERKSAGIMESVPVPNAPPGAPPLPALPADIPVPNPVTLLDTEKPFKERVKIVLREFREMFSSIAYIFWVPLSWFLTFAHSSVALFKTMMLLPLTIVINIYERRVRARFPGLPSVWLTLNLLFPNGFFPSFSSGEDLGKKHGASTNGTAANDLPTLDIDMDAIRAGNSDAIASSISNIQGALKRK